MRSENDEDFVFFRIKKTADASKNIFKQSIKKYPGLENFPCFTSFVRFHGGGIGIFRCDYCRTVRIQVAHCYGPLHALARKSLTQVADVVSEKTAEQMDLPLN